jgi:hypothetical protein
VSDKKSTKREIAFWWNKNDGEIHLSDGHGFIVTVASDHVTSERGHRKLFEWLRSQLEADGKPAPEPLKDGFQRRVKRNLPAV